MAIYDPLGHVQTEKSVDLHGHRIKLLSRKHVHSQGKYKGWTKSLQKSCIEALGPEH